MVGIAIVYDIARWEERALIEAIRARGLKPQIIHVEFTNFTIGDGLDSSIDIVLQRSLSHSIALTSTILLESSGLEVVNNSRSIAIAQDKVWTLSLLSRSGIPAPKTIVSFSEAKALEAANMLGYPVVIKPINGSWGRLVSLAPDEETLRIILEHRLYTRNPYMKVHLIQEYVRKPGRDIRVFVVGDEVPVAIYRVSNHWITNTARGGKALPAPIDEELRELSIKTAKTIGVEIAGIDIFEDNDRGYLVNEVNAIPDFRNTVPATGYNLQDKIIEYLISKIKR